MWSDDVVTDISAENACGSPSVFDGTKAERIVKKNPGEEQ